MQEILLAKSVTFGGKGYFAVHGTCVNQFHRKYFFHIITFCTAYVYFNEFGNKFKKGKLNCTDDCDIKW